MTPEEVAQSYLAKGGVELQTFKHLEVGARVKHVGERWSEAYQNGTGVIERIFHFPNSNWSQKYGREDVELIVHKDSGDYSYVADYHVERPEL